jgi:hypothetical protein
MNLRKQKIIEAWSRDLTVAEIAKLNDVSPRYVLKVRPKGLPPRRRGRRK